MTVSDGTESAAPTAPETPASEAAPEDPTTDLNAIEAQSPEADGAEPPEDLEEFDWNGKRIAGPKGLKDSVLMHADYTRKTQEVAAARKELEQQRQLLDQHANLTVEEQRDLGRLTMIEDRIAGKLGGYNYEQIDWDTWQRQNPAAAQQAWMQYQRLKDAKAQLQGKVQTAAQSRTQRQEQETATRLRTTLDYAQKNIKGWNSDLDGQITAFAIDKLGYEPQELLTGMTPRLYATLHRAWVADASQSPQAQNGQANGNGAKPLTVVSSRSSPGARKSLADMDMDEYAAARKKQSAAR